MFYSSPAGSYERHQFLENVQSSLLETLNQAPIEQSLGTTAVKQILAHNELLVIPNIRNDRVVWPKVHKNKNTVPFVALKKNEVIYVEREDIMPTPRQRTCLTDLVEDWAEITGTKNPKEVDQRLLRLVESKIPTAGGCVSLSKNALGGVAKYCVGIHGKSLGLTRSIDNFYVRGRPVLALAYSRGYNPAATLVHELIHVRQALKNVAVSADPQKQKLGNYRHELEAHHYSAVYAEAILSISGVIKKMWQYPNLAKYMTVENIRREFADPTQPFEPTEQMIKKLDEMGFVWRD